MKKFSVLGYLEKNALNIFIVFLFILNVLPILAPILAHFGFIQFSKIVYEIYSFFCHQRAWRSIHVFDYQFAWCVRDTFIYFSLFISLLITKYSRVKSLKWYLLILFTIPIALDGGIQTVAEILTGGRNVIQFYESSNITRMLTGSLFGLAIGFWMWPNLRDSLSDVVEKKEEVSIGIKKVLEKPYVLILVITLLNIFGYILMVLFWNISSTKVFPTNFIDSLPKAQSSAIERCKRASDSTNPKTISLPGCE